MPVPDQVRDDGSDINGTDWIPASAGMTIALTIIGQLMSTASRREEFKMSSCENCKFRAKYDKNPRSILGRIWKWHIGWCPGWKTYLKSQPDEKRAELKARYH